MKRVDDIINRIKELRDEYAEKCEYDPNDDINAGALLVLDQLIQEIEGE